MSDRFGLRALPARQGGCRRDRHDHGRVRCRGAHHHTATTLANNKAGALAALQVIAQRIAEDTWPPA